MLEYGHVTPVVTYLGMYLWWKWAIYTHNGMRELNCDLQQIFLCKRELALLVTWGRGICVNYMRSATKLSSIEDNYLSFDTEHEGFACNRCDMQQSSKVRRYLSRYIKWHGIVVQMIYQRCESGMQFAICDMYFLYKTRKYKRRVSLLLHWLPGICMCYMWYAIKFLC